MKRAFQCIRFDMQVGLILREAIRPYDADFTGEDRADLHCFVSHLLMAIYEMEADATLKEIDLKLTKTDVLIVNAMLSNEDGGWAVDLLHQTRQVLYELENGKPAVKLADIGALLREAPAEEAPES